MSRKGSLHSSAISLCGLVIDIHGYSITLPTSVVIATSIVLVNMHPKLLTVVYTVNLTLKLIVRNCLLPNIQKHGFNAHGYMG